MASGSPQASPARRPTASDAASPGANKRRTFSRAAVVSSVNWARTQNGHIRNDTRDVSRRISMAYNSSNCRRNCVASARACTRVTPRNLHGKECDEGGPPAERCSARPRKTKGGPGMLYAGLDLSRKRLDVHLLDEAGVTIGVDAAAPHADGLRVLAARVARFGEPVHAAIESMNGARFIHDQLELAGWRVDIADAVRVKGMAPLACKTDRIDAWVLAELARRELVPAIWLPDPEVRAERERARFRLHLVRHRSSLKQRVHALLLTHGQPCPVSDLFGASGRALLERLALPEPWAGTLAASLRLIDELDEEIAGCERELRQLGAEHRYVPLLLSVPGISAGSSPTRSRPRSARSSVLPRRANWLATAASARACTSQAPPTGAVRSPRTARATCAGRWSRRRPAPADTRSTANGTNGRSAGSAASGAPRSPRSTLPTGWPKRSGTCSPASVPSLRQAPRTPWPLDGPQGDALPERASHPA